MIFIKCIRCNNQNPNLFYTDEFGTYCRKCITFNRININTKLKKYVLPKPKQIIVPKLPYPLTSQQLTIAQACIHHIEQNKDVMIHACCGSGKTEMIIPVIAHFINQGKTIGMAISRRQVVLELQKRLSNIFPTLNIIAVCDGYTHKTKAEFIICTTHQLYRYYKAFDILILDEIDAFPFKNNELLATIAQNAYCKNKICLSATLDTKLQQAIHNRELVLLSLYQRYHGRKLIVPTIKQGVFIHQIYHLLLFLHKYQHLTCFIFVATKKRCYQLQKYLNYILPTFAITSETKNKDDIITNLKTSSRRILITTTIMERGVTIADACVFVLEADHQIFDEATLIQIAGRVDRAPTNFHSCVYFSCKTQTAAIKSCIKTLRKMNQ